MADAARDYEQDARLDGSPLLHRLLTRPMLRVVPPALADEEAEEESADEALERLEAENQIMKAVLRSERAEAASLRARIAELSANGDVETLRTDRDRWASLVQRLLFAAG
ncbi:hypothetical protein [Methylobacterium isbiliense]|jgi:hypothetical protein|uniref:Uncharacterized protein n=1 Tax=Methylobacterium isbiliense TaxID=315478 RepID=A0ABQ4S7U6_9HYPH|nr:hypothetical protein [Methylobacterium isbiliense]MDN3626241.1 hypothetical protein [Methylobacterium isbiliense]GJD99161.1 hypothetical protein GMJLKIPL_1077 [Methylobacterium isbiliense]